MAIKTEDANDLEQRIRDAVISEFVSLAVSTYNLNMAANITILSEIKRSARIKFKGLFDKLVDSKIMLASERMQYHRIAEAIAKRYSREGITYLVMDIWSTDPSDIYKEAGRNVTQSDLDTCQEDKRGMYEMFASHYEMYKHFMDMHDEVINLLVEKVKSGRRDVNQVSIDDIKEAFTKIFPNLTLYLSGFINRYQTLLVASMDDHTLLNSVNMWLRLPKDEKFNPINEAYEEFLAYANAIFTSTFVEPFANRLNERIYGSTAKIFIN